MRIMIDIDPGGRDGEPAPPQPPATGGNLETGVEPSTTFLHLATGQPGNLSADPMSSNAGMAASLAPGALSEPPAAVLVQAAGRDAHNAGPAPGFADPGPVRTEVTQADDSPAATLLEDESTTLSTCRLAATQEGGISDGGPASTP
jgi:hypothetical protein